MTTDQQQAEGRHDALTDQIIRVFYDVYNELGYGFLESIYREAMRLVLSQNGLSVAVEYPIQVSFRGTAIGLFKADLIVDQSVLIELKTCEQLLQQHQSQTLNYLKSTSIEVALLMNFGPTPRFKRLVLDNSRKHPRNQSAPSVKIGVKPSLPGDTKL